MAQLQSAVQAHQHTVPVQTAGFECQIVLAGLIRESGAGVVERKGVIAIVHASVVDRGFNGVRPTGPGQHPARRQFLPGVRVTAV